MNNQSKLIELHTLPTHPFLSNNTHLDPVHRNNSSAKPALFANQSDEDPFICLMAKYENSSEPKHSNKWFVDSGCSNHMTFSKALFSSYTSGHPSSVQLGNSTSAKVAGIGTIVVTILVHGRKVICKLKNVLHVPDLGFQQLYVPTFDKQGLTTSFHSGRCWISKNSKLLATATMSGNLIQLDLHAPTETALAASTIKLWHYWKIRIQHVLALKDLDNFLEDEPPTDSTQLAAWTKKDRKAQAIIGLTLSNDLLENVRDVNSTKNMWLAIKNVSERHTLLNKLSARKKFYSATMESNESVLKFSNRIRHLAATLKSMNVSISDSEMAMALPNGLPCGSYISNFTVSVSLLPD